MQNKSFTIIFAAIDKYNLKMNKQKINTFNKNFGAIPFYFVDDISFALECHKIKKFIISR